MQQGKGIYTMEYHLVLKKRGKFWHMLQHGWTLRTLRQVRLVGHMRTDTAWFHLYEASKIVSLIDSDSRIVMARAGGWGAGETIRHEVSIMQDE
jgi:hypothetical protein